MIASTARRIRSDQRGFTLPELLVVVLIIAILATISLTVFLRQQQTGHDASAKAGARELVTMVESCNAEKNDYTGCDTTAALGPAGLSVGSGPGDVEVTATTVSTYSVRAHSRSGNWFDISRGSERMEHACGSAGRGGCHADSGW
ncbi:MAG: type II secretion system protein [Solirubrobacteraceae bacterium]